MIMDTKILKKIFACLILSVGVLACQRVTPEEITELLLSNCLTPVSLKTSVSNDYDVKFSWIVAKDADYYRLVVASDAEYTEIIRTDTVDAVDVPYTLTLVPGVYYYKVQALAEDRGGSHWAYGEFTLKRPVCDVPTNPSVKVIDDCKLELMWDISRKSELYDVVIASDAEFTEVVHTASVSASEMPYSLTLDNGEYYFMVKARAEGRDDSDWSVYGNKIVIMKTVDIGVGQTANCYIVSAFGKYRFKAVKGCKDDSVGEVAKAELIWETSVEASGSPLAVNSVITQVYSDEGYIYFVTSSPLKEGNALIAAKDATGKILWSWHIWIVADSVKDVDLGNDIVLMDRNLGEVGISGAGYSGMLYQWGRKDPFPGTLSNGNAVSVAGTAVSHKGEQVEGVAVTIANPTMLYGAVSTSSVGAQPYFLGKGTIDGTASGDYDYWGTAGGEKTEYDPCPAGYRVPHASNGSVVNSNDLSKTRFSFFSGFLYEGESFEMTMDNGACLKFRRSGHVLLNTSVDQYEKAGSTVTGADNAFLLWTASRTNKRLSGCIRVSESEGAQFWGKGGDNEAKYQAKNNAYPIRCEKIR